MEHEHYEESRHEHKHAQGLGAFSPKQTFSIGLVGGVLVLCTIGFFILLAVVLKGDAKDDGYNGQVTKNDAAENTNVEDSISVRAMDEKTDHIRGNKKAEITIVTYTDMECPFCKRFHDTMKQVMDKYGDDIKWVMRHMPLDNLHSQARLEAIASECAGDQDKFWEFVDLVFAETASNDGLDLTKLPDYAKQVGLNVSKFNKCYEGKESASKVQADEVDAQKAGGQGTPYSVLVGPKGELVPISGAQPFTAVESAIKKFLK